MQEQNLVLTFLLGGAAAVTIAGALLALAHRFIMNSLGLMLSERFNTFKDELVKLFKDEYLLRSEFEAVRKSDEESRMRQDIEINRIWEVTRNKIK